MSFETFPQFNPEELPQTPEGPEVNPEHDRAKSAELLKFKGEVEKIAEGVESLLYELRNRLDSGFIQFISEGEIDHMSGILANIKSLDVYSDHGLEETNQSIEDLCSCIDSIEMQPQKGMNDDIDSVQNLAQKLGEISQQAGDFEFASKQLGPEMESAVKTSELAQKLEKIAIEKAEYIHGRAEIFARYLGQ